MQIWGADGTRKKSQAEIRGSAAGDDHLRRGVGEVETLKASPVAAQQIRFSETLSAPVAGKVVLL